MTTNNDSNELSVTAKETSLLMSFIKNMNIPATEINKHADFNLIATECGYKDAKNAKVMFGRLKTKLDEATLSPSSNPTAAKRAPKRKATNQAPKRARKRGKNAKAEPTDQADEEKDDSGTTAGDPAAETPAGDGEGVIDRAKDETDEAELGDVDDGQSAKEED